MHLLHVTMAEFSTKFPTNYSFMSVSIEDVDGEGPNFEPIFQSLSERHDFVLDVLEKYNSQPVPIGVVSRLLGVHPLDVWRGFQADPNVRIFCCDGSAQERQHAVDLVGGAGHSFVVDPLTLYDICAHNLQESVTASIGKLGVTQSCLDFLTSLIKDRRLNGRGGRHGYMAKKGSQYLIGEYSQDEIDAGITQLEECVKWVSENCEILKAIPEKAPTAQSKQLAELMDPAFSDLLLAADGSGRMILSDDQRLRFFAKQLWGVDGVWLQIVLMRAVDNDKISFHRYCEYTVSQMRADICFTTANHRLLLQIAENENWESTKNFREVAEVVGGENVDLQSSLEVAFNFLLVLWEKYLPLRKRNNLTFAILDAFISDHRVLTGEILSIFVRFGGHMGNLDRRCYLSALSEWCAGHFIPMPNIGS